jgi:hypothetical protein
MFRRGFFALLLIGAAFAGGALINGPGLAWLQRNFAAGRSIIVDASSTHEPASPAKLKPFPTASTTPVLVAPPRPQAPARKKAAETVVELAQADPPLLPESPSTPAAALAPLPEPAPAEPVSPPTAIASVAPPSSNQPRPATLPTLDPVTRLASLERPEPSANSVPADWTALRKKMKALGVARYTIEGEADGHVRFSCVIPVDGLKAVGHHFEAEADDECQAAEAALKRVALWKATQD